MPTLALFHCIRTATYDIPSDYFVESILKPELCHVRRKQSPIVAPIYSNSSEPQSTVTTHVDSTPTHTYISARRQRPESFEKAQANPTNAKTVAREASDTLPVSYRSFALVPKYGRRTPQAISMPSNQKSGQEHSWSVGFDTSFDSSSANSLHPSPIAEHALNDCSTSCDVTRSRESADVEATRAAQSGLGQKGAVNEETPASTASYLAQPVAVLDQCAPVRLDHDHGTRLNRKRAGTALEVVDLPKAKRRGTAARRPRSLAVSPAPSPAPRQPYNDHYTPLSTEAFPHFILADEEAWSPNYWDQSEDAPWLGQL